MYYLHAREGPNIHQENENKPVNIKRVANTQRYREPLLALPTNPILQKRRAKSTSEDGRKQCQLNCKVIVNSPYELRTKQWVTQFFNLFVCFNLRANSARGSTPHHNYKIVSPYSKWIKKTTTVTTEEVFVDAREYVDTKTIQAKNPIPSDSTYVINSSINNIAKPPAIKRTLSHRISKYKPRRK